MKENCRDRGSLFLIGLEVVGILVRFLGREMVFSLAMEESDRVVFVFFQSIK